MPTLTQFEPWMLDVVADVYETTEAQGIPPMLTLRCRETAGLISDPKRRASCAATPVFGAPEIRQKGSPAFSQSDERKGNFVRREIEVRYRTKRFPKGVPIGVNRVGKYVRSPVTGEESFVTVQMIYDVSYPQLEVLQHIAEGRVYPTDSDRAQSRRLVAAAEVNARKEKMDPIGTEERKAVTLAKAIRDAGVIGGGASPAAMSDEELAAEVNKRKMAKARAARGKSTPAAAPAGQPEEQVAS